jgi:hypothetical protein
MVKKKWCVLVVALLLVAFIFLLLKPRKRENMSLSRSTGDERVDNLMKLFRDAGVDFEKTKFNSSDRGSENVYNFSYDRVTQPHLENTCGPDCFFISWPSAGIDSFEETTRRIMDEGEREPSVNKVGWCGNLYSAAQDVPESRTRPLLKKISDENPELLDVVHVAGNEIRTNGISLEDLVKKYEKARLDKKDDE